MEHLQIKPDIVAYFHCKDCLESKPSDIIPAKWAMLNVGWTQKGLQIWCERCGKNVLNLDFKGQKVSEI